MNKKEKKLLMELISFRIGYRDRWAPPKGWSWTKLRKKLKRLQK